MIISRDKYERFKRIAGPFIVDAYFDEAGYVHIKLGRPVGTFYRARSRLLHRFNLHHTRSSHMEDGSILTHCDWCGIRGREVPLELLRKQIQQIKDDESTRH